MPSKRSEAPRPRRVITSKTPQAVSEHRSLIRLARESAREKGIPDELVEPFIAELVRQLAGQTIYVAKADPQQRTARDQQILAQAGSGMTRRAIAKAHSMSASQVQRVIAKTRAVDDLPADA